MRSQSKKKKIPTPCPNCGAHLISIPKCPPNIQLWFLNGIKWKRMGDWYCPNCAGNRFFWQKDLDKASAKIAMIAGGLLWILSGIVGCSSIDDTCNIRAASAVSMLTHSGVPAQTLNALVDGSAHSVCIYYSEGKLICYDRGSTIISDIPRKSFPTAEYVARLVWFDRNITKAVWQKDMLPLALEAQ